MGFFTYYIIGVKLYLVAMANEAGEQFAHVLPAFGAAAVEDAGEVVGDFVEDLVLAADEGVDLMVHEAQVDLHQLLWHGG